MPARRTDHDLWLKLAAEQEGLISRAQLRDLGLPESVAENRLRSGQWCIVAPGVYRTTGQREPLAFIGRVWAAILYAGSGAAASGVTALVLNGVADHEPAVLEVSVPRPRQVRPQPGLRVRQVGGLAERVHPVRQPPRLRIEVAVMDQADAATWPDVALDPVFRSTQRRLTTASRLREELHRRPRHRWRSLLQEVLAEVEEGTASALELRYLKQVERAHGLPRSERNLNERSGRRSRYRDFFYADWNLVVETDGREAHPPDEEFRLMDRDNTVQVSGRATLRYGYREIAGHPCAAAVQVITVLRANGWPGHPRRCCALCPAGAIP